MTEVHYSRETVPNNLSSVVSVGKFDGVHTGHRSLLSRMKQIAAEKNLATVLVTFDRNPLELIDPKRSPASITSLEQKVKLLSEQGLDHIVILEFNEELKDQEPQDFVKLLANNFGAKEILIGRDFRFGRLGQGDVQLLRDSAVTYGFNVELVEDRLTEAKAGSAEDDSTNIRISSSLIREALEQGLVEEVAKLLGRNHSVTGTVVHGLKRGRELGFPTANLEKVPEGCIPGDGIYAGWLFDDGKRYAAAISVGDNPTFDDVFHKQVEAYLPGVEIDLYDHVVTVEFVARIRGMVAFDSMDDLITQMHLDETEALRILS